MAALYPFLRDPNTDLFTVSAHWERTADRELRLKYKVIGPAGRLALPAPTATPARREGLWEHTCFELFLALPGYDSYWEWNFSPSGDWALFEFTGPRLRSQPQPMAKAPRIREGHDGAQLSIEVLLDPRCSALIDWAFQNKVVCEASVTAVLEQADGSKSYWAAKHAGVKPDFHDRNSFIFRL
jgi:hypothetical protein